MMDANVLLLVLGRLNLPEVAAASQVCSMWSGVVRSSEGLWKQLQHNMLGKRVSGTRNFVQHSGRGVTKGV
jgi:hypothetical protein